MLNDNQALDPCPRCGKTITFDGCERHPTRPELELRNYRCVTCGPVKTVVSLRPRASLHEVAA
jgi:hypothetical protein